MKGWASVVVTLPSRLCNPHRGRHPWLAFWPSGLTYSFLTSSQLVLWESKLMEIQAKRLCACIERHFQWFFYQKTIIFRNVKNRQRLLSSCKSGTQSQDIRVVFLKFQTSSQLGASGQEAKFCPPHEVHLTCGSKDIIMGSPVNRNAKPDQPLLTIVSAAPCKGQMNQKSRQFRNEWREGSEAAPGFIQLY